MATSYSHADPIPQEPLPDKMRRILESHVDGAKTVERELAKFKGNKN